MDLSNHALFQVTLKAIVKKKDTILLLHTQDDSFDFPGGRVDESEVNIPLMTCLKREITEECGQNFQFVITTPAFIARRYYNSHGQDHKVLAVYYEAIYKSGDVELSDEHSMSRWVEPSEILKSPDKFVSKDEFEQFSIYLTRGAKKVS